MEKKKLITSILVLFTLYSLLSTCYCFAATQIPTTARANVAPQGQYAPTITVTDQTMREEEPLQFEVLATDANLENTVYIEITQGQPPWLSIVSNTDNTPPGGTARMVVRAAPPRGAIGRYRVYFTATDNSPYDMSSTKDIYIIVNPSNQAPVITADNQAVQVGRELRFTVNCTDPDSQDTVSLTYLATPNWPSWLSPAPSTPVTGNPIDITFTGTPQVPDINTYTMTFDAVDNGSPQQRVTRQITITVSRENHPPVLAPIRNKEVPVRVKLEFTISATDADNDILTYEVMGLPSNAQINSSTGKFTWTPTNDQAGDYPAHFEVSDGIATDSEDIIITVSADDTPVFDPLSDKYIKVEKPLSFVVTAKDPNNDALTYSASNLPPEAVFNNSTHTFTWTPTLADGPVLPEQVRAYRDVMFQVTDGTHTATKGIWIFVRPTDAPDLDYIGDKYVSVDQTLTFTVNASDPNGDSLTYSANNLPSGASFDTSTHTFTWTPNSSQIGAHRDIMFTVSDGTYTDTQGMWIFVQSNGAPTIDYIGDKYVVEGRTLSFSVNATDPNDDSLSYSAPNLPVGAEFNTTSAHTFTWTPAIGQAGVYRDVRFVVSDGTNTVHQDIWIFVEKNEAPIVDPLTDKYVKAGELLSFGISAYSPAGHSLTYRALNLPPNAEFLNQTFKWTPNDNQVGIYRDVMFEVSDDVNHLVTTKGIWIFVTPRNAPVLDPIGDKYITAGDTLSFTINANPTGNPLTYSVSNNPPGSTLTGQVFTWVTNSSNVGTYRDVMFTVTDTVTGLTDTKGIWIFVRAWGAPQISIPADQYVSTGHFLEFGVSATDTNTPQSGLTYSVANKPPGATFINQVFNWSPTAEQVGTYPDVTFTVSDGTYSDSKALWIFVTAADAPYFEQDVTDKYGRIGEPIIFSVTAKDPNGQPLTYSGINLPRGATFTSQTFSWTPEQGQAGTYRDVRLEVKDHPDNNIDSDTFWIFIAANSPPDLDTGGTKYGSAGHSLTFTIYATDLDGDHLTFTASNLPTGSNLVDNENSRATFTWPNPPAGTYPNVHFEVSDGALTDSENISIVIS